MKIKCHRCGYEFEPVNKGGIPNGIGFSMRSGNTYNFCRVCITLHNQECIMLVDAMEAAIGGNNY